MEDIARSAPQRKPSTARYNLAVHLKRTELVPENLQPLSARLTRSRNFSETLLRSTLRQSGRTSVLKIIRSLVTVYA